MTAGHVQKLRRNPQAVACQADAAAPDGCHAEPARRFARVAGGVLEPQGRIPRRNTQVSQLRKAVNDFLSQSVAEIIVTRLSTQVLKGEHGDSPCIAMRLVLRLRLVARPE